MGGGSVGGGFVGAGVGGTTDVGVGCGVFVACGIGVLVAWIGGAWVSVGLGLPPPLLLVAVAVKNGWSGPAVKVAVGSGVSVGSGVGVTGSSGH